MNMTLKHSKTWPINAFAVVQLELNSQVQILSALSTRNLQNGQTQEQKGAVSDNHPTTQEAFVNLDENQEEEQKQNSFKEREQNRPHEPMNGCSVHELQANSDNTVENCHRKNGPIYPLSRKHLELFTKISPPPPQYRTTVRTDTVSTILEQEPEFDYDASQEEGRRPSIRVDNWDYIYAEKGGRCNGNPGRVRCPIHRYGTDGHHPMLRRDSSEPELPLDARKSATLRRHYYPEGGWGWVIVVCAVLVNVLNQGVQLSSSQLIVPGVEKFKVQPVHFAGWLGAVSTGVALLISPVTIAFCRRKSTRVTAVMGGLITALGCLFTSFATQFHQLFFSYGAFVGIGVGITRDCSTLMVAQYFKRKREFVEIFIVSGSGLGIATMSTMIKSAVGAIGWRLGLQIVTGAISTTFILGTCYRSASLYHPQRRAILHIKNQKRKIKDKNKIEDKIPFFDFSTLKSKTVRILLISTGISAFGINTPLFYLAYTAEIEGLGDYTMFLQVYLGLAWALGCVVFSTLVLHNSTECRIARQYLCQTAVFMCGLSILAFTVVSGNYSAYVMFAWIYGIFCGGYHYSLKMYTYERVRARNFARTWGFVQCSQAIPIVIGVPFSGYMNENCGDRSGYYFSSTCVIVGSLTLFMIDLHRRNISRHKHTRENGTKHLCVSDTCPQRRKLSFSQEPDNKDGILATTNATHLVLGAEIPPSQAGLIDPMIISTEKPELTCISEEGIADMDFPDNLLDDLDYIGDCITSCNKVENYLMLSEFENNLIAEMPVILDRKGRRWSLARSKQPQPQNEENGIVDEENGNAMCNNAKWKLFPNRVITVIDESSV